MKPATERLDRLVADRGLAPSREAAQALILAGVVRVGGETVRVASRKVAVEAEIVMDAGLKYVSRGGLKLEAALDAFGVDPTGLVCADIGASTGGFTDCLLQRGAERVYAVDVGRGQLAEKLRRDPRVVSMEKVNARSLAELPEPVSLVVIDVSFISLDLILPSAAGLLAPAGAVIALVKPQFEAGRAGVGKGGVVRDLAVREATVLKAIAAGRAAGLGLAAVAASPLAGPAGNREFFLFLRPGSATMDDASGEVARMVQEAGR